MSSTPLVTLIVPTVHHRAALYARTLRYLGASGYRGPIVVSDHSPAAQLGVIAEATRRHAELDVRLLEHPPELHFLARLARCAEAAPTPYVHLHADDDFVVLPTLHKLVELMQRDPACGAAMGVNLHVRFGDGNVSVLPKRSIAHAAPFERLVAQLESYSSVLYALRRREEMAQTFSFTLPRCPDVQFWQYLESCVAALRGPILVLEDALHYVRGVHEQKWSSTLVRERSPDHFPYLILSGELTGRVAAFRAALVEACAGAGAQVDAERLDTGLIHLLHRGLGAMGLPPKTAAAAGERSMDAVAKAMLTRLQDPRDAASAELQRIFRIAGA